MKKLTQKNNWKSVLELDNQRQCTSGSDTALAQAIRQGADLRIYTEFHHHEHVEPGSANKELVKETSDLRVTYLVENHWSAGIMNLRMPIEPPFGFGPRPSMSFFMYNQNGDQAIARPFLDGQPSNGMPGSSALDDHSDMPKYHQLDGWDADTNAPCSNFIYDFEVFRYFIRDEWQEVFAHAPDGTVTAGSLDTLVEMFTGGAEVKVAIRGLCNDLDTDLEHEVFIQTGPGYYSTESEIFCAGTQPVVRVKPGIPMRYESCGWDFGWLMVRTDGFVARWLCDPYTLTFHKSTANHAIRWFVR